jgi:hypothetical protein
MNQIITSHHGSQKALHHLLRLQQTLTHQLARNQRTCWEEDSPDRLTIQNKKLFRQLQKNSALLQSLRRHDMPRSDASSFEFH